MWPPTEVGQTAIQKCPGGSEAEGIITLLVFNTSGVHYILQV